MSGSVTPARRPREDDESDVEDYEVSIDGEGSARSNGSKRPRLNDEDGDDEVSEVRHRSISTPRLVTDCTQPENSDLLPDSFRRSPKGKGRAVDGLPNGQKQNEHQPGSIVRVTLTNFVTYTKAEFHPGPNLNMIIGPNGTGKSTLVCAICLGLGWATSHLGRAKDLGEFVKHGAKRATIEIELAADPARHRENQVITTTIAKDGNKAEYFINRNKANKKGVQTLARSFSIQVDNLCQFLPQDRVVEFAALSPVDLLTQTQRAAAPEEMSEWHDTLKTMRKDQKQHEGDQQRTLESLKNDQNRQRNQEADVVRLRERTELQQRVAALEKLRPFPEYKAARAKFTAAKERRKEADKELRRLDRRLQPNLHAVEEKQHYLERIEKVVASRKRLVDRHEGVVSDNKKKIEQAHTKMEECLKEIAAEKNATKETKQKIPRFQQELARIQRALQHPPEPFDPAEMNERIREKSRQMRDIEDKAGEVKPRIASLGEQGNQRKQIIETTVKEKNSLQSQAGQQANKLKKVSRDAATAWDWIQKNRNAFQSPVYGPPIIECTVKDQRHADAVETMIPDGDKLAFTVTSHDDFKMLQKRLYGDLKLNEINIRNSMQPLSSFRAPVSDDNLRQYGLECWILDLIEGPDAVLAMLCDNRNIHQTAYASREISSGQFDNLKRSPVSSWVTPTQSYMITRRREYGEHATSTRVQGIKKARFFTDAPVDRQMEDELNERINQANSEIEELRREIQDLKAELLELQTNYKQVADEKKALEEEKKAKQRAQSEFNGLPIKEQHAKSKLDEAKESVRGYRERVAVINDRLDDMTTVKGQHCLDYANSMESMRNLHVQLFEAEILQVEAKSDHEQLKAQHAEEVRLLAERRTEVEQLQEEQRRLLEAGKVLEERCRLLSTGMDEYVAEVLQEIEGWEPEQLDTEIQSVEARLDMTSGAGGENTLREYEERARRIEHKRARLAEIEAKLDDLGAKITDIRERWEPRLDALVVQISEAFAENFLRIQCAGEVMVHKDEDFEQWAIEIKVKFRYVSKLTLLIGETVLTDVSQGARTTLRTRLSSPIWW